MARPELIDWAAFVRQRDRSAPGLAAGGDFLIARVAAGLAERLGDVRRDFQRIALLGTGGGAVAAALGRAATAWDPSPAIAALSPGTGLMAPDALPLAPESQDLILNTLLLHAANDPVGQLVQMRRALVPDGLMIAALFGGQTLAELRAALAEAEVETTGGLSPRVLPMGEIRDLGGLLQRAGFALPVADSERWEVTYPDALALMRDLRAMGEGNAMAGRRPLRRATLARACEIYAAHFPRPGGRIRATFEVVYLTGWAPGPDQPQPLRPGSATTRLADALGSTEFPAGEATAVPPKPV